MPEVDAMVNLLENLSERLRSLLLVMFGAPSLEAALLAVRTVRSGAGQENHTQPQHLAILFERLTSHKSALHRRG